MAHIITAPLRVQIAGKKWFVLNLNQYRNTHFFVLNKAKKIYAEAIQTQVELLPAFDKVIIHYMLFTKDRRMCDLDNVLSIHAKFFQDCLVQNSKLKDDTYLFVVGSTFEFGIINKTDPHVRITIQEYP